MPLSADVLAKALEQVFVAPPETAPACAQAWADAVETYASSIVPPSTTVSAAAASLSAALTAAFLAPAAVPAMEAAFAAFVVALGGGMAGFTPVPPAGPVGFAQLFQAAPQTHADAAAGIADAIHTWMTTGTATLIAPPFTASPWS